MARPESGFRGRLRRLMFAVCAACTLWLVVQNTILFTLIPHVWVPAGLRGAAPALFAAVSWGVPLLLIPLAFALGWLASHRPAGAARSREGTHE